MEPTAVETPSVGICGLAGFGRVWWGLAGSGKAWSPRRRRRRAWAF